MSEKVKAIPTEYGGITFRSRTEARWAVFFDALGIEWQYEPEGFEFDDGTKYLPDFYLPESKTFFECKGVMTDIDRHKIEKAMECLDVRFAVGYPDLTFISCETWEFDEQTGKCLNVGSEESQKYSSWIARCRECHKWYFLDSCGWWKCRCCGHYDGNAGISFGSRGDDPLGNESSGDCDNDLSAKAFKKAINTKFDHGQAPDRSDILWEQKNPTKELRA